jgi:transmembrane sensor
MNRTFTANDAPTMTEQDAQAWVIRLASRHVTTDDAQDFKDWCAQSQQHVVAFVRARSVWLALRPAAQRIAQKAYQQDQRAAKQLAPGSAPGRRAFLRTALAASVGYLALSPPLQLWPSLTEWAADYRTATGEQRKVVLADGTVLQMNTQTRLNVASGDTRVVDLLAGEVEVGVVPGTHRLEVAAASGMISGDDASFNVRNLDSEVCVTCLAGRIDVAVGKRRVALDAGNQLTYGEQGIGAPMPVNPALVSAWRQRSLVFNQTPLAAVVAEVNRYRPGKLVLANASLGRNQVQANISIDHLDDVIALIRDVYGAEVTHLPGGVIVFG